MKPDPQYPDPSLRERDGDGLGWVIAWALLVLAAAGVLVMTVWLAATVP